MPRPGSPNAFSSPSWARRTISMGGFTRDSSGTLRTDNRTAIGSETGIGGPGVSSRCCTLADRIAAAIRRTQRRPLPRKKRITRRLNEGSWRAGREQTGGRTPRCRRWSDSMSPTPNLKDCKPPTPTSRSSSTGAEVRRVRCVCRGRDLEGGGRCGATVSYSHPLVPDHVSRPLFAALLAAQEEHMLPWVSAATVGALFGRTAWHPRTRAKPAPRRAEWLEGNGLRGHRMERVCSCARNLDDIPDGRLPDGVELRPVTEEQIPPDPGGAQRGVPGRVGTFRRTDPKPTTPRSSSIPTRDETLVGRFAVGRRHTVVGQVKSFISPRRRTPRPRATRRGYTEYISTHRDLAQPAGSPAPCLAMSLHEAEAPGDDRSGTGRQTRTTRVAHSSSTPDFGFELQTYDAVYTKAIH